MMAEQSTDDADAGVRVLDHRYFGSTDALRSRAHDVIREESRHFTDTAVTYLKQVFPPNSLPSIIAHWQPEIHTYCDCTLAHKHVSRSFAFVPITMPGFLARGVDSQKRW